MKKATNAFKNSKNTDEYELNINVFLLTLKFYKIIKLMPIQFLKRKSNIKDTRTVLEDN